MNFLILGTPSGGTRYAWSALSKCGIDMGHEVMRSEGGVGFDMVEKCQEPYRAFHQTRDPIPTISSLLSFHENKFIGEPWGNESRLHYMMRVWLGLHLEYEKVCEWRYAVEDLMNSDVIYELESRTGWELNVDRMSEVKRTYGTRVKSEFYRKVDWDDLHNEDKTITGQIQLKAEEYGYAADRP